MSNDLFAALEACDSKRLAQLLDAGSDPNALQQSYPSWTPLHAAIEALENGGSVEAIVLLLRHGASPNGWDGARDSTPLLMAIFRGQPAVVRLLLASGADPNVVGAEGDSPLRWCAERGDLDGAALLLRCGAARTIDSFGGPTGMTALGQAASSLRLEMIELLISEGADVQALDGDQRTAHDRLPQEHSPARESASRLLSG
ncbi:MAG TPA: ankyrin repeat domain-containing protein [Polyangiaceae bacterium]|nr:ankyrin repeat domain-containing protein [Polyangiaceae bacterium]